MYCTHCGAKIDDNARFCPECGKSMSSSQPRVPEYTPEPTSTRRRENTSFKKPQFKKEGSGGGSKVFFKILAVAIVGLLAYLGYDYFTNGVGGADKVANKIKPYFHLKEEDELYADNHSLVAPSDLSLISYFPTRKEIESVEPIQVEVSAEHPICRIGDIIVEFSSFEFDEFALPDTFQLRQLGTRHDDASGRDLTLFDFSLKSGKHQFSSDVHVTFPRPASGNGVLYYNESTKSWELASYSITDDLKNYIMRTDHFSGFSISEDRSLPSIAAIPSDLVAPSTGIAAGTIDPMTDQEKADHSNDSYYYVSGEKSKGKALLVEPIGIHPDRFKIYFKPAFVTCAQTSDYLTSEHKEELENAIAIQEFMKGLGLFSEYQGKVSAATDLLVIDLPDWLGDTFSSIGYSLWAYKMANSLSTEDFTWENFIRKTKDNFDAPLSLSFLKDFVETKVKSGVGTTLANFALPIKIILSVWTLWGEKAWKSFTEEMEYVPIDDFEFFYHRYLESGVNIKGYGTVTLKGNGWEAAIGKLLDDAALQGSDINQVNKMIDDLYSGFVNSYFELSEDERNRQEKLYRFAYDAKYKRECREAALVPGQVEPLYSPRNYPGMRHISTAKQNEYKQNAYEKVMYYSEKAVSKACKRLPDILCDQLYNQYHDKYLPYLNTMLIFTVKDKRLLKGSTFDKSPYNINGKIKFNGTTPFGQIPLGTELIDFDGDVLNPYAEEEGSDIIFSCSRYYYMQMGCPTSITFSGEDDLEPITIHFSVPNDVKRSIIVNLGEDVQEEKTQDLENETDNADNSSKEETVDKGVRSENKKGAWVKVATKMETKDNKDKNVTYSVSELSHTVNYDLYLPAYDEWHRGKGVATCNAAPPDVIHAGDSVVFHVSVDAYDVERAYSDFVSGDIHFDKEDVGLGYISGQAVRATKRNEKGDGMYLCTFNGDKHGECDYVLHFTDGTVGTRMAINFTCGGSRTHWVYEWK